MEQSNEVDPEVLERQRKLWKAFGRETKAGKELFELYNLAEKPKINYPKPKSRTQKEIEAQKQKMTANKKCPQKTQIQYPELGQPEMAAFHAVDLIPKRKNEVAIRKEIDEYYQQRKRSIPVNRGVDRANLVRKLQDKFKLQRGALPKGAELPGLTQMNFDEKQVKEQAKLKADRKGQSYTNPLKQPEKAPIKDSKSELEDLFDDIVKEIDERQRYLDSIDHLDEPELKQKIKREMIERVGQLQKITEMRK